MHVSDPEYLVTTAEALETLYGPVGDVSLKKEIPYIHPHYRRLIEASPFAVMATSGPSGLDASPRGDPPGFVVVEDEKTLLLPERRGNNRVDSLRNLITDPRLALFFLIPGLGETLRVNGRADISIDPVLLDRFAMKDKPPKCVLVIRVESVYFQCARAIRRSKLWDSQSWISVEGLPSAGTILSALTEGETNGEKYDRELDARQGDTLY